MGQTTSGPRAGPPESAQGKPSHQVEYYIRLSIAELKQSDIGHFTEQRAEMTSQISFC